MSKDNNWWCRQCAEWKPTVAFHEEESKVDSLVRTCLSCQTIYRAEAEINRRHADAVSHGGGEDVGDEPMSLEQRLHLHRMERNRRRRLAERLYRDLLNDELRVRLATGVHVELALPWQAMACCAVEGTEALLIALDGHHEQQQIPPYEA